MSGETFVFDTGAFFLYFAADRRVKEMFDAVAAGRAKGYTCEANLAELYYKTCERLGREAAEVRQTAIRLSKISVLAPDERLTRLAGGLKCTHRGEISLTDAYVAAVANTVGGTLITTDRKVAELKLARTRLLPIP